MILTRAGFAPIFRERPLDAPELAAARAAVDRILKGHEPHPALAVDRNWTMLSANKAISVFLAGVADHLVADEVNVLKLSLHPEGLSKRILNFREWRAHLLSRLAHEVEITADARLIELLDELKSYPVPLHAMSTRAVGVADGGIVVPLTVTSEEGPLSFISTTTVFGTAVDVTLSEVTIETSFPANSETTKAMEKLTRQH